MAGLRSDHAAARGVGISVSDNTIYRALKELGFLTSQRPSKRPTNRIPRPWRLLKICTPGGSLREARARRTGRGVVPGRNAGRAEEQAHLPLGSEGLTSPCRARSAHPIDLPVRGSLPRPRRRCSPRTTGRQQRSHAASSRRDYHQGCTGRPCHSHSRSGWHGAKELGIPTNISRLPLPPRSPELNSQENIWQFMRQNWLSNRIFKSFDDIVDHCCYAWNTLIGQPWKIMSIARRNWATVGHSL
jgi:hypothetical protein